jgi:cytoskeletal protein RodZ
VKYSRLRLPGLLSLWLVVCAVVPATHGQLPNIFAADNPSGSVNSGGANIAYLQNTTSSDVTLTLDENSITTKANRVNVFDRSSGGRIPTPTPTPTPTATPTATPTPGSGPAVMVSPAPGSTFGGSTVTFQWTAGSATAYALTLSSSTRSIDIYNSGTIHTLSVTVSNIPTDGRTVFATLYSQVNNTWLS